MGLEAGGLFQFGGCVRDGSTVVEVSPFEPIVVSSVASAAAILRDLTLKGGERPFYDLAERGFVSDLASIEPRLLRRDYLVEAVMRALGDPSI